MKCVWVGTAVAALLLASEPAASSPTAALQISVTVQRSCAVTRVPAAATIQIECTRSRAPAPVVQIEQAPLVLTRPIEDAFSRVEILF